MFPPPADFACNKKSTGDVLPENKFELVFEEEIDSKQLKPSEDEVISNTVTQLKSRRVNQITRMEPRKLKITIIYRMKSANIINKRNSAKYGTF